MSIFNYMVMLLPVELYKKLRADGLKYCWCVAFLLPDSGVSKKYTCEDSVTRELIPKL